MTVTWSFDDGATTTVATDGEPVTVEHAYGTTGEYAAVANVRDDRGRSSGVRVPVPVVDPGNVTRVTDVSATAFVPEVGSVQVTWNSDLPGNSTVHYGTSPDDLSETVRVDEAVTDHVVNLTGLTPSETYHYRVQTEDVVSSVRTVTAAPDRTGDGHVVVATVDSGVNPYHEAFRRPGWTAHPATYLSGFPERAEALDLTFPAGSYWDAVQADADVWAGVEEHRTYWVPGTNLLVRDQGDVSFVAADEDERSILDEVGHGTQVAGTVNQAHSGATILAVESTRNGALDWAARQPYVDVISLSYGAPASGPLAPLQDGIEAARENGKVLVVSAGNNPNPQVLTRPNGPPKAISVGGAHPEDGADAFTSSKGVDVVSDFTVGNLPEAETRQARGSATGTSFSAPNVAGTLARVLEDLRERAGDTDEAKEGGLVDVPPAMEAGPYLDDGVLGARELRDAMNRTARYQATTDYDSDAPLEHPLSIPAPSAPGAPWVQQGWGYVGPGLADDVAATAAGEAHPTKSPAARTYMEANHRSRQLYHRGPTNTLDSDTLLDPVSVPGPPDGGEELANPVETPHPYPNDAVLTYSVREPGASALSLHFQDFSVETGYDRVEIHREGADLAAVYTLDGRSSFWTPYLQGDALWVLLHTDHTERRHGFTIDAVDALG
jgi:hypothetical protein